MRNPRSPHRVLLALVLAAGLACPAAAQLTPPPVPGAEEARIVRDAAKVLDEALSSPGKSIPRRMIEGAEGVAIIPRVIKGGFILGARHGRGVIITKDAQGAWHAPVFLSLTGGNVGWQAGVQSVDVVQIYRSQRSVESLMQGKFTIGADAAAAAGPVGREASAATDVRLNSEVYSYSRGRGLFAGVSLDGSVVKIDHAATAAYYRPTAPGLPPNTPLEAQALTAQIIALASPQATTVEPPGFVPAKPVVGARHGLDPAATVRDQLADAAPRLFRLLTAEWQEYLALPADVFRESGHASAEDLAAVIGKYNAAANDPRYADLAGRPEFQAVHAMLRQYAELTANRTPTLTLPPPPAG